MAGRVFLTRGVTSREAAADFALIKLWMKNKVMQREQAGLQSINCLSEEHFVSLSGEAFVFLNPLLRIE